MVVALSQETKLLVLNFTYARLYASVPACSECQHQRKYSEEDLASNVWC